MGQRCWIARTFFKAGSLLGGAALIAVMSESVAEAQTTQTVVMQTVEPLNAVIAAAVMVIIGITVYIVRHKTR